MVAKIRVLDQGEINKIAAGEVIENPSSVVKELLDNAIDAGASEICVEIQGGGRHLIRVSDNGIGMSRDDALLCLERHATSKIKKMEDIYHLNTMGFRGEALPSIASISKFMLLTCPKIEDAEEKELTALASAEGPISSLKSATKTTGTLIVVEGGKILKVSDAVRSAGTTFEIKSLFYNVPVRLNFLKSPAYDTAQILHFITLAALAYPEIHFSFINNGKMQLEVKAAASDCLVKKYEERVQALLGSDWLKQALPIKKEGGGMQLSGWIGKPSTFRSNRKEQYLFINRRSVFSKEIAAMIKEGYGPSLPQDKHPVFLLLFSLDGHLYDVNVHPQKREIRLRREALLRPFVLDAVDEALRNSLKAPLPDSSTALSPLEVASKNSALAHSVFAQEISEEPDFSTFAAFKAFDRFASDRFESKQPPASSSSLSSHSLASNPVSSRQQAGLGDLLRKEQVRKEQSPLSVSNPVKFMPPLPVSEEQLTAFDHEPTLIGTYKEWILLICNDSQLERLKIEGGNSGICLVNRRLAAMRLAYEKYLRQLENGLNQVAGVSGQATGHASGQRLLFPLDIELTHVEAQSLHPLLPHLAQIGLELKSIGQGFSVEVMPKFLKENEVKSFLQELALEVSRSVGEEAVQQAINSTFKAIALKASRYLYEIEPSSPALLVKHLFQAKEAAFAPNGKKIAALFKEKDLENLFS